MFSTYIFWYEVKTLQNIKISGKAYKKGQKTVEFDLLPSRNERVFQTHRLFIFYEMARHSFTDPNLI
jgi:hypothetical protein